MPRKTTIYIPDDLKSAIEREALRRGCSEAQVIRDAVAAAVQRPRPNAGILDEEPIAARIDEFLVGFGER
ncbi:MAG: CopG family transcriptional regulator [Acidimicrobiales bacterium]